MNLINFAMVLIVSLCLLKVLITKKKFVCILYVGQMRDNTAMNTQNHVDWINKQFPSNEYTVHIYFVTDMVNIRELFQHDFFASKVKNIVMDYNYKKTPYIYDARSMTEQSYHEIMNKTTKSYDNLLTKQIETNMRNTYNHVYTKEKKDLTTNFYQFKKLQIGILLKRMFEKTNGIKYDYTFKIRPDITFLDIHSNIFVDKTFNGFYIAHDFMFGSYGPLFDKLYDFVEHYGKLKLTSCLDGDYKKSIESDSQRWYKAPEIQLFAYICKIINTTPFENNVVRARAQLTRQLKT